MFLQFYGFHEQPFGVTPDPRFLYMGQAQTEAYSSLIYGIETGRGFMALIASPGLGKTTMLYRLMDQLRNSARTAFLFCTHASSEDFLRSLLADLEIEPRGHDLGDLQRQLGDALIAETRAGKRFVVAIDEAQNLDDNVLEMVRTLSNFETAQAKLLQIILVGQPQLAEKLASPQLEQLRQRVSIVTQFPPLQEKDIPQYIEHRLRVAGYRGGELFTAAAMKVIVADSKGIPRNINNLCFHALSLGFAKKIKKIDEDILREVVADLNLEPMRAANPVPAACVPEERNENRTAPAAQTPFGIDSAWVGPVAVGSSSPLDGFSLSSGGLGDVNPNSGTATHPYSGNGARSGKQQSGRPALMFLGLVALVGCLWGGHRFKAHYGHLEQAAGSHPLNASDPGPAPVYSPSTNGTNEPGSDPAPRETPSIPGSQNPATKPAEERISPDPSEGNPASPKPRTAIASTFSDTARTTGGRSGYFREVAHTTSGLPEGSGRLIVESSQSGARIAINGAQNPYWTTPKIFHLAPGTYMVSVSGGDYSTWTRRVHIDEGQERLLMAELVDHDGGFFTVDTAPPGMQVFIDGKPFGPSRVETVLQSGWHVCEVVPGPGLQPLVRKFHLGPGESVTRRIRMSSPEASLGNEAPHPAGINPTAEPSRGTP